MTTATSGSPAESRRRGDAKSRKRASRGPRRSFYQWFDDSLGSRPGLDYLMLRIIILALIGIGLLMAYSASMASSWVETDNGSVWTLAFKQTAFVALGLILLWLALKTPPHTLRRFAGAFAIFALILLIVVLTPLGTGREEVGSQSWIAVGSFTIQPSEVARIAIGIYGAATLSGCSWLDFPRTTVKEWVRDPYTRFLMLSLLFFSLILLQGDVGMAALFGVVAVLTLFFAGMTNRIFIILAFILLGGIAYITLSGGFRSNRFITFFDAFRGHIEDTQGTGFQTYQGLLSLADGGAFGVGIGQSRAKWFYLPEARNDFVFAIVGEELGLWGAVLVIVLFAMLGFFGIRTAMRAQNQFQGLIAATLTATIVSQAVFNISYVIGLMPVTGVQLPLISSGGSATIVTIGAMGLLCSVARHEPQQVSAMQSTGRPLFDRIFFIQEPLVDGHRHDTPQAGKDKHRRQPRSRGGRQSYATPVTARRTPRRDPERRDSSQRFNQSLNSEYSSPRQTPRRDVQRTARQRDFDRRRAGVDTPRERRYRH